MKYNKYFDSEETACKCGCGFNDIDERVIWIATCARIKFNKPVTITSGCRCSTHNKNVGGASKSQHLLGTALDIKVKDVTPNEVQAFLDDLLAGRFGVGYGKTFTHIDVRDTPARFDY